MKTILLVLGISWLITAAGFTQNLAHNYFISKDLELVKINENAYVHVSYTESKEWGRFPSNGMIFINKGKAFLLDTPTSDSLTMKLLIYLRNSLKLTIVGFITNDWHSDSMGGLAVIHKAGIPSYANEMTRQIATSKGLPVPQNGFKNSTTLLLGDKKIVCSYYGPAHTLDNIVVWIPSEKILFADCMIKEMKSQTLGNIADGDVSSYASTVNKVKTNYPNATVVIPGHGDFGGLELIDHTLKLSNLAK
jgi:metallo-beta-lactamase class B